MRDPKDIERIRVLRIKKAIVPVLVKRKNLHYTQSQLDIEKDGGKKFLKNVHQKVLKPLRNFFR